MKELKDTLSQEGEMETRDVQARQDAEPKAELVLGWPLR
jgi:hypothetical protein